MVKQVLTPVFRVSFPSVFEASSYDGGPLKYSVSAVWDPSKFTAKEKARWDEMIALCDEVSMERFKKAMADLPGNFKKAIRDGAEKADLAGYGEGTLFANLSSKMKPGIVDLTGQPVTNPDDFYPGCYARAFVTAYAYDNKGKGVAMGLQNLQFVKDGERLDARTNAADAFAGAEDVDDLDRFGGDPLDG